MHSIRTKLAAVTLTAILISVLTVGTVGILSLKDLGSISSRQILSLLCEREAQSLELYFSSVMQTVDTVSNYAEDDLTEISDLTMHDHVNNVMEVFSTLAESTQGVMTFYYRVAPEISARASGFWFYRDAEDRFIRHELTDVEAYDEDDISHVGWYSIPKERGEAVWMNPYYNENLGAMMISYVRPIYSEGKFIGVIGVDIDYATLVDRVDGTTAFRSGYAFLTDEDGKIVYHPNKEIGSDSVAFREQAVHGLLSERVSIVDYQYEQDSKLAACCILANGMRLYVTAPQAEISSAWVNLESVILAVSAVILLLFVAVSLDVTRRITAPLQSLTEAAKQLEKGNYDFSLDYRGNDEVGVLTSSFASMSAYMQEHINDLNSRAYRDQLTNVRNKAAYEVYLREQEAELQSATPEKEGEESSGVAICMFDCNELKYINDMYGHARGDVYLRNCCELICQVFSHSPVFRIGGDEFLAVLKDGDFLQREKLLREFQTWMDRRADAANPWERVSVAFGLAIYNAAYDRSLEDTVRRSDRTMYQNKRKMKSRRV